MKNTKIVKNPVPSQVLVPVVDTRTHEDAKAEMEARTNRRNGPGDLCNIVVVYEVREALQALARYKGLHQMGAGALLGRHEVFAAIVTACGLTMADLPRVMAATTTKAKPTAVVPAFLRGIVK